MRHRFFFLILLVFSINAKAGILGDMNTMFLSNTTAPSTISTQDRIGVFAGSLYMRSPVQSINLVSFDPPRIDAGCGGIDLYGGSFSFINSQQLVQIFRNVASNAAGLAFKAAIKAISPSLDSLITEFQTLMQNLNNLAKNSCQMAHMLVDPIDNSLSNAVNGSGNIAGSQNGLFSDAMAGLTSYLQNANSYFASQASYNPKSGNEIVKATVASGASAIMGLPGVANIDGTADNPSDPNALNNRLIVSLLGYKISGVPCSKQAQDGTPDTTTTAPNSTVGQVACTGPNTITLMDLVKGGGTGSVRPTTPLNLYTCVNPQGTGTTGGGFDPQICTSMQVSNFTYEGIEGWVNTTLFGSADISAQPTADSIVGIFNSGQSVNMSGAANGGNSLSASQIQFIHLVGVPFIPLMTRTNNPNTRLQIAQQLSPYITECVAAKMGEVLYRGANEIQNSTGYEIDKDQKHNLDDLRTDYLHYQYDCNNSGAFLRILQTLNAATRFNAGSNK